MTRNKAGTEWVKESSGTRTLARAKALWQKTPGPKPRGGEMGVDGVSERRKKGVQGEAGTIRNGQTGVLIDHSGRQPYPGDRAADMV